MNKSARITSSSAHKLLAGTAILLCVLLTLVLSSMSPAHAKTVAPLKTSNAWASDYYVYGSTDKSSLAVAPSGNLERVEFDYSAGLIVEEYSASTYKLLSKKVIDPKTYTPSDLAKKSNFAWGGVFQGARYNYVVTGQENPKQKDSLTVVQVTKYSKNWGLLTKAPLKAINTYSPFYGGSCRLMEYGGCLWIHTCQQMYKGADGIRHQKSVSFVFNEETMEPVANSATDITSYVSSVSHSFNQHLASLGDSVYLLDHGDAYPRGASITKAGEHGLRWHYSVYDFAGEEGDNYTYAATGGISASETHGTLLAVGCSGDQEMIAKDEGVLDDLPRNVWLSVFDASIFSLDDTESIPKHIWLTSYKMKSKTSVSNPQIVKITDDKFMVAWGIEAPYTTGGFSVRYQFFDGLGNPLSRQKTMSGALSDCQPIVFGKKVIWYFTGSPVLKSDGYVSFSKETAPVFLAINTETYSPLIEHNFKKTITKSGITYTLEKGKATVCKVAASKSSASLRKTIWVAGECFKVCALKARVFANTNVRQVTLASNCFTRDSITECFAGSKVAALVVPKSSKNYYKKVFTPDVCGKRVAVVTDA